MNIAEILRMLQGGSEDIFGGSTNRTIIGPPAPFTGVSFSNPYGYPMGQGSGNAFDISGITPPAGQGVRLGNPSGWDAQSFAPTPGQGSSRTPYLGPRGQGTGNAFEMDGMRLPQGGTTTRAGNPFDWDTASFAPERGQAPPRNTVTGGPRNVGTGNAFDMDGLDPSVFQRSSSPPAGWHSSMAPTPRLSSMGTPMGSPTTMAEMMANPNMQGAPFRDQKALDDAFRAGLNIPDAGGPGGGNDMAAQIKALIQSLTGGGGGGGGGVSAAATASYQNALDAARANTRGREDFVNQGLLDQIRGVSDIDAQQQAYNQMLERLMSSVAQAESAGAEQLGGLRGDATAQLENILGAMEEQRARSAGQVSDIYGRAGEQIRNLENVYGGRLGGIGEEIARGAAGFGVQGGAPEGLGGLSAIAQQANVRQGAAMDAAMASRAGVASGLQFDRSQEIQREYDTRMADLAQQARSARTAAELQQVQAQAQFERQRSERALAAAQQEDMMNQRYMEYLMGLEREQRGIMTDAGARGVSVV